MNVTPNWTEVVEAMLRNRRARCSDAGVEAVLHEMAEKLDAAVAWQRASGRDVESVPDRGTVLLAM